MKIKHLLLLAVVAAFSSCSTAYRTGQTPDDVYYSPAPQSNTYVTTATEQDKNSYSYRNQEEADIRRGIEDPVYRSGITFSMGMGNYSPYSIFPYSPYGNPFYNPYGYNYYGYDPFTPYAYNPYGFKGGMYSPYNSFIYNDMTFYSPYSYGFSPYYGLSPYYNPYYPIFYSTGDLRVNTNTGARRYNLNVYNNNSATNRTGTNVQPIRSTGTGTTQPSTGSGVGNVIRRVFTPSQRSTYTPPSNNTSGNNRRTYNYNNDNYNNNNNSNYNTPQRTFTPSTPSNSSSSSSGNSNSAPVRTFRR